MIKVFVNLPSTGTDADWKITGTDRRGNTVPIEADSDATGNGLCVAGFWVEPVGSKNTDLKFLGAGKRARMTAPLVLNEGTKFKSSVVLPPVGGDQYKVKVKKVFNPGSPMETEVFETWRRFYIAVHHMNASAKSMFDKMKPKVEAVFKKAFIDVKWEPAAPTKTLVDEPWTPADVVHLPHLYDAAASALTRKPFHMRLVIVNDLFDKKALRYTKNASKAGLVKGDYLLTTTRPLGYTKGALGCTRARVRETAADPWTTVTQHVERAGPQKLKIHLHRHPDVWRLLKAGKTLKLEVDTEERDHGFCGYSLANFCTIRCKEPGGLVTVLQTFTHEVGHSLSQAVDKEPLFDATTGAGTGSDEVNSNWHGDDHGGQGPHCHLHATLAADPDTTSGNTYVAGAGDLCTMFFRDDNKVAKDGSFCAECEPRLKRLDMSEAAQKGGRPTTWPPHPPPNWDRYS